MTEIVLDVECPECGEVELGTDQVWLVVASEPSRSHYAFLCPSCGHQVSHHAGAAAVDVLSPLVAVWHVEVPAEALEQHDGPPLTLDDLIDLGLALERAENAEAQPPALAA